MKILRYYGEPKKATFMGKDVYRKATLFAPYPYNRFIPCAPYDDNFIFEVPDSPATKGIPSFMCTCGSFAEVVGMSGYANNASPSGLMWVCNLHASFGHHSTGENRWV